MNKEYYEDLIKKAGKHIENHASDYLNDYEISKIRRITFSFDIQLGTIPAVTVEKEYIPDEVF